MKSPGNQPTVDTASSTERVPWQFYLVMIVIAIGVLGLVAKGLGLF